MIIGDQPAHYRYAWDQTQYRQVGDPAYLNQRLINAGGTSLLTPADPELAEIEPNSFHYFHLVIAAGPYMESGFFRLSVNESVAQLCTRLGLTQLTQPRLAGFTNYYPYVGEVRNVNFLALRLPMDPITDAPEDAYTIPTEAAYTAQEGDVIYALFLILGAEELQTERPLLLLPIARGETLPVGSHIRTENMKLYARAINTRWEGFSVDPYRGRN